MLNVILVTDKKAGHESISKGLLSYIQKKHDLKIHEVYAKRRIKALMKIGVYLVNFLPLNRTIISILIKILYKNFQIDKSKKYNFLISTGGDTALLNILLSKYLNIPNFYCSSLRGLNPNHFTNIVSIVDNGFKNEILVDIAPINIDIEEKELPGKFFSILIGGATKNYDFTNDEFYTIVEKLTLLAEKKNFKIFLTTSRRTPLDVEAKIKLLVSQKKELFEKTVFYNEKPEKVVKYFLKNSDVVFCTEDSGSMITESVLSKKKVYSIFSKNKNLDKIFTIFMNNLTKKKYLVSLSVEDINNLTLDEKFNEIDYSPAQRVYDEIKKVICK